MASGSTTPWQIDGQKLEAVTDFFFFWSAQKSLPIVIVVTKSKDACSLKEKLGQNWTALLKKQRHHFSDNVSSR